MSLNRLPGIANPSKHLTEKSPRCITHQGAQKSFNYVSYHYMKTVEFFKLRQPVPADLKSAVKKVRPMKTGDL